MMIYYKKKVQNSTRYSSVDIYMYVYKAIHKLDTYYYDMISKAIKYYI